MLATTAYLALCLTGAAFSSPLTSRSVLRRSTNSSQPAVIDASYDGQCFYPKPTSNFELDSYLGRWYQVAGTLAPFTAGCKCIYADYSPNDNGTVNVQNGCELQGREINIQGTATPVSPYAGYGHVGVLKVQFPGQPAPDCPGPNYIVQEIGAESSESGCHVNAESDDAFAIVQASNFTTLFVLSRQQNPANASIEAWLQRAKSLGSDLSNVAVTDQSQCQFT
ncbi:Outer membrane lipoprotein Blc [Pseudocercospora fuligena]|uniref:Outer membrane lipoprotein Blc n=1 Tax=Pseudocercospora fuligena TaxID=685502 RepID=A0A8H6VJ82_9PEZI|nr:Outer membrane lipoprotein Blc [Pseudocercospora fuligena]